MKYGKRLGILVIVASALMAVTGSASATITSPAGTVYNGPFKTSSSNFSLDGSVKISCSESTYEGSIDGSITTATLTAVTFSKCSNDTWVVTRKGFLTVSSSGVVASTGMELTTQMHRTVLGFPVTTHCIYRTNNTAIGTLTESVTPAVWHIGSSPIPEVATDGACGSDAVWTGSYTVTTPSGAITID